MVNNIRIKENNNSLMNLSVFFFFIVALNSDFNKISILWWGSIALVISCFILSNKFKITARLNSFKLWAVIFIVICLFSGVYAIKSTIVFDVLKTMIIIMLLLFILDEKIKTMEDINKYMTLFIIATIVTLIYLLIFKDMSQFQLAQYGWGDTGNWNGNDIGIKAAVIILPTLYVCKEKKGIIYRIIPLAVIFLSGYVVIITGSRKSIVMLVLSICAFIIVRKPKRFVRNTVIIIGLIIIAYIAVLEVPYLYKAIGWRVEALTSIITGTGSVDSSTLLRQSYIDVGVNAFKESPFFGYGVGNFSVINASSTGHNTYSHNNFIEMLVGVGLFGFVAYYWIYVHLIVKFVNLIRKKKSNLLTNTLFAIFFIYFVLHYGLVTYTGLLQNFLILLLFKSIDISERNR